MLKHSHYSNFAHTEKKSIAW